MQIDDITVPLCLPLISLIIYHSLIHPKFNTYAIQPCQIFSHGHLTHSRAISMSTTVFSIVCSFCRRLTRLPRAFTFHSYVCHKHLKIYNTLTKPLLVNGKCRMLGECRIDGLYQFIAITNPFPTIFTIWAAAPEWLMT